ncbi:hypothetical protein JCM19239_3966 [Vibrio variabilis]|uniref:Uncharacterized protein n=1 Tax=Vibrio variabilis TaxID=990271 RepID=A0ABQ0J669_9VIBR|nr:hypothetical protein JCM19239_3966 [Vibrio variabilis]
MVVVSSIINVTTTAEKAHTTVVISNTRPTLGYLVRKDAYR